MHSLITDVSVVRSTANKRNEQHSALLVSCVAIAVGQKCGG